MAFIIKKKRYKFAVDLTLNELTEVSFGKAILFAKVRQLDGGSFSDCSKRQATHHHRTHTGNSLPKSKVSGNALLYINLLLG